MAILSDEERAEVRHKYSLEFSQRREGLALTKAEIREAVNATDQWVEDNKASFNSALPEPFKTTATSKQKSELLTYIVKKRWELE